jgi:hypothetical protein
MVATTQPEVAEAPWRELQVGFAISGKMAYLSFFGGLKVTNANLAFLGVP